LRAGIRDSETYSRADTQTSSSSATNYNYNDSYNGSANGNTNYSLSEVGNYANHSWAVTSFTESEQTTTSANYSDSGAFSGNGNSGNFTFSSSSSSNFNLAANGSYANGSFSFVTFSASLVANASTTHTETGTSPGCGNYSRTDTTSHSVNLTELEKKRLSNTANYTLTLSDSASHTFTCGTFTYTGSSSVTTTATGSFSLAGGNPYIPNAGGIAQAAGAQVGVQIPWYSSGGQGSGGGSGRGGQGSGPNRVTVSVQRITAERLEPQWMNIAPDVANVNSGGVATSDTGNQNFFNAVPGSDVGLPTAGGDEPNLGLPAGPNGPAALSNSTNGTAFAFGSAYSGAGGLLLPPLTSPQQSPNNGPYKYSFVTSGTYGPCYCPHAPTYNEFGGQLANSGGQEEKPIIPRIYKGMEFFDKDRNEFAIFEYKKNYLFGYIYLRKQKKGVFFGRCIYNPGRNFAVRYLDDDGNFSKLVWYNFEGKDEKSADMLVEKINDAKGEEKDPDKLRKIIDKVLQENKDLVSEKNGKKSITVYEWTPDIDPSKLWPEDEPYPNVRGLPDIPKKPKPKPENEC
jgi:hypothetical protein